MKKFFTLLLTLSLIMSLGATAFATATVEEANVPTGDYTVEEMLSILLKDEYQAKALYEAVIKQHGNVNPFANLIGAEENHIEILTSLMTAKGFNLPAITVSAAAPSDLAAALKAGEEAEIANIALYEKMLAQDNLPADVRDVFQRLMRASQQHLRAFSGTNGRGGRAWAQTPVTEEALPEEEATQETAEETNEAFTPRQGRGRGQGLNRNQGMPRMDGSFGFRNRQGNQTDDSYGFRNRQAPGGYNQNACPCPNCPLLQTPVQTTP